MKDRPILFNGAMVRAILEGRKTQTRREVKPQPWIVPFRDAYGNVEEAEFWRFGESREDWPRSRNCPFGQPGDRLWVREAFAVQPDLWSDSKGPQPIHYLADTPKCQIEDYRGKPSIHMPRWASRITLEITGVCVEVERLEDITEEGARAEGFESREAFLNAFRAIYKIAPDPNPWVWVIEFKRVEQ